MPARFVPNRDILVRSFGIAAILTGCATEDEPVTCPEPVMYRVDHVVVPVAGASARAAALDLDGDRRDDNYLGEVQASLVQIFEAPFDLTTPANAHLATDAPWHVAVRRCSNEELVVAFGQREAIAVAFDAIGSDATGIVEARGIGGAAPLSILFDPSGTSADPGWVAGLASAASFAQSFSTFGTVELTGRLAIALPEALSTERIIRPMVPFIDERAQTSAFLRDTFDANDDGRITFEEVRDNTYTESLLAPDLVFDAGRRAHSLSIAFHATLD